MDPESRLEVILLCSRPGNAGCGVERRPHPPFNTAGATWRRARCLEEASLPLMKGMVLSESSSAKKCADCGQRFKSDDTRWDVHVGGGTYKTVCTKCFDKNDSGWTEPKRTTRSSQRKSA